jgi:hypothetical protein
MLSAAIAGGALNSEPISALLANAATRDRDGTATDPPGSIDIESLDS